MRDAKIHALLVDEEMARRELTVNITALQECRVPQELFTETVEQVFITVQEYMVGVKDVIKKLSAENERLKNEINELNNLAIEAAEGREM